MLPGNCLYDLLRTHSADHQLPALDAESERILIRAAQGRPGWILQCVQLQGEPEYWHRSQLSVARLCEDTESALRESSLEWISPAGVIAGTTGTIDAGLGRRVSNAE